VEATLPSVEVGLADDFAAVEGAVIDKYPRRERKKAALGGGLDSAIDKG
jgi:hypothetical protein